MLIEKYDKTSSFAGQRILYKTLLFGKEYYWLQDIDSTVYLLPIGEDGKPVFA